MEERDTKYYSVFHGAENKKFHDQLSLKVCEKLVPLVEKLLLRARQKGEMQFDDIQAAAMFCVYGQLGILLADDLTQDDKSKRIREFLIFALHLWNWSPAPGRGIFKDLLMNVIHSIIKKGDCHAN